MLLDHEHRLPELPEQVSGAGVELLEGRVADKGHDLIVPSPRPARGTAAVRRSLTEAVSPCEAGNRRLPSFWVSRGAPRLGWCWAGTPHTWLGASSASARRAA
ncbi:MAG: DUF5701 family protein [Nocardioidaceae bacterium]